MLKVAC